MDQIMREGG
jgi:hypothetical protein